MTDVSARISNLSPEKRALFNLRAEKKERLSEPVAIIGVACRFPGAENPEAFWRLLRDGVDAISEVPADRWDINTLYDPNPAAAGKMNTRWGGFIKDVDQFDAQFFGILTREANQMDPQHRIVLEVAAEAIEDAGIAAEQLAGTQTGVFTGIFMDDYRRLVMKSTEQIDAYVASGSTFCAAANRISYLFDLRGPSLAIDTACSSSLVAVHLACQSLLSGESTLALAGGVNLLVTPEPTIEMTKGGFMAPDGRCKTFDARANGYVRSEGAGIVLLKPLSKAMADGDRIYAIIRGSAVNQDGHTNGLTAPNQFAQEAVLREAYRRAGVSPARVRYVEAHGTGTALGDPIEARALANVLSLDRAPESRCAIGSVKTNIGHLETAAGIAGLIKVVLSLNHRMIPPSLHFQSPNPNINFDELPLRVQQTLAAWPEPSEPLIAGVSSFGMGGTNAHVVLEQAPVAAKQRGPEKDGIERPLHILTLSAKSNSALTEMARRYDQHLASHAADPLQDVCFTASSGRSHFSHRLAIVAGSNMQLRERLKAFTAGKQADGLLQGESYGKSQPGVVFMFTGQGSEHAGMGRRLYETQPGVRKTLELCEELLKPHLRAPLLSYIYPEKAVAPRADDDAAPRAALFALEYALAQLWMSWGIQPDAVIGYGIGEYVAACVAGVFSLEDGLKLAAAAHPGELEAVLESVEFSSPSIPLVTNTEGELCVSRRLLEPLSFAGGIESLQAQGYKIFLEIGPQPVLCDIVSRLLSANEGPVVLPSLPSPGKTDEAGEGDWASLLSSLARLYVSGLTVDWRKFDGDYDRQRLALPTYPFQRQRFWIEERTQPAQTSARAKSLNPFRLHPLLDQGGVPTNESASAFQRRFLPGQDPVVDQHQIRGKSALPAAACLEMALASARLHLKQPVLRLQEVVIAGALKIDDGCETIAQVSVEGAAGSAEPVRFSLISLPDGRGHVTGTAIVNDQAPSDASGDLKSIQARCARYVAALEFYPMLERIGISYGPYFRSVEWLQTDGQEVLARLRLPAAAREDAGYILHPSLIEGALQSLAMLLPDPEKTSGVRQTYLPFALQSIQILGELPDIIYGHAARSYEYEQAASNGPDEAVWFDVKVMDERGRVVVALDGVCLKRLPVQVAAAASSQHIGLGGGPSQDRIEDHGLANRVEPSGAVRSPEGPISAAEEGASRDRIAEIVVGELAAALRINPAEITPDANLFELGLDSLIAVEVTMALEEALKVPLGFDMWFRHSTVAKISEYVAQQRSEQV
jgi:acyl transferase domain-containing protein/acyl carrier protein